MCLLAAYAGLTSLEISPTNDKVLHFLTFFVLTVGFPIFPILSSEKLIYHTRLHFTGLSRPLADSYSNLSSLLVPWFSESAPNFSKPQYLMDDSSIHLI